MKKYVLILLAGMGLLCAYLIVETQQQPEGLVVARPQYYRPPGNPELVIAVPTRMGGHERPLSQNETEGSTTKLPNLQAAFATGGQTTQSAVATEAGFVTEMFLKVFVNEEMIAPMAFVGVDRAGAVFISRDDIPRLRLRPELTPPLLYLGGVSYLPISKLTQPILIDPVAETLRLTLPANYFTTVRIDMAHPDRADNFLMPQTGAVLNYSVNSAVDGKLHLKPSLAFEPTLYSGPMLARSSFYDSAQSGLQRLNSTLLLDDTSRNESWVIGDNVTRSGGSWGRSTPFIGVSWGSNFYLDPRYSPYANFSLYTRNDLPVVLEMMSDGAALSRLDVPSGPLEINNLPTPDAYGNLTVRITDIQGQVKYIQVPYLKISNLYAPGAYDYNISGGLIRRNVVSRFGSYADWVVTTTHRYGISPTLTAALHLDMSRTVQAAGVNLLHGYLPLNLLSSTTLASSHSAAGEGLLYSGTLSPIKSMRSVALSGGFTYQSMNFSLADKLAPTVLSPLKWSLNLALGLPGLNLPLGLGYTARRLWDGASTAATTLNYSATLFSQLSLSASLQQSTHPSNWLMNFSLAYPLESRRLVSVQTQTGSSGNGATQLDFYQPAPYDSGVGYRLSARASQLTDHPLTGYGGVVEVKSSFGQGSLDANKSAEAYNGNANFSGSIGILDGKVFLAPSLDTPFALVKTGDAGELPRYRGYNRVATSNADGWAIIPQLVGFQKNVISFRPEELAFDISMDNVEKEQIFAPYSRGGVVVNFPLKSSVSALVILVDAEHSPLPAGAEVTAVETGEVAYVTLEGRLYLTNITRDLNLRVDAGKYGRCATRLIKPVLLDNIQPVIGPLVCPLPKVALP